MSRLFTSRPPVHRAARTADARAIAAIHAEGFARGWPPGDIEALLADAAVAADVAVAGRWPPAIVGFALSRVAVDEAELLSIGVRRSHQARGVAGGLLAAHLAHLGQRGVRALFLEVEEGNAPAARLYSRFGFQTVGRRASYYPKADGRSAQALVMRLAIG
jgi:ribosomal-protein-alanine N-acetyltransferase